MRVFTEPKVILVSRPTLVDEGVTELLAEYGFSDEDWRRGEGDTDGDSLPELMGRLCYGSFGSRQGRVGSTDYHHHLLEAGHGSVLEHATWSFVVCRASRGYTHQQVRHRAGFAYAQESSHFIRYGSQDTPGQQEVGVCLTGLTGEALELATKSCEVSIDAYADLWARLKTDLNASGRTTQIKKLVSGTARGLLPTAVESRLGVTANARALRHFCELRGNPDNTLEIRLVAVQILDIMKVEAPSMFLDMGVEMHEDGYPVVTCVFSKV